MTRRESCGDSGIASWLPAIALIAIMIAPLSIQAARPGPGEAVVLLFPPWWSQAQAVGAAGTEGELLGVGLLHNLVIVRPYQDRQIVSQAWLHLNTVFAGWCGDAH